MNPELRNALYLAGFVFLAVADFVVLGVTR